MDIHNKESIKDKIRKLLNLSNDSGAAEGEIENALRFAATLMDRYNLKQEDLASTSIDFKPVTEDQLDIMEVPTGSERMQGWEGMVAVYVAKLVGNGVGCCWGRKMPLKHFGTDILVRDPKTNEICYRHYVKFFGPRDSIELASCIYHELIHVISAMARLKFSGCYRGSGRSYCEGFVSGLNSQLAELRLPSAASNVVHKTNTLMALTPAQQTALAAHNAAAAKTSREWYEKKTGYKLRNGGSVSGKFHSDAFYSGRADGQKYQANATPRKRLN